MPLYDPEKRAAVAHGLRRSRKAVLADHCKELVRLAKDGTDTEVDHLIDEIDRLIGDMNVWIADRSGGIT